jgi:hypothetical protein
MLLATGAARAEPPTPAPPPWHEGEPVPPGYHRASHVRRGLVAGGASLFVLPYLASAIAATTGYTMDAGTESARGVLWVPAVGPFIMMGSTRSAGLDALLVLDGLAQIGGITLFACGLATPEPVIAPNAPAEPPRVSLAPLVTRGGSGLVLMGSF